MDVRFCVQIVITNRYKSVGESDQQRDDRSPRGAANYLCLITWFFEEVVKYDLFLVDSEA